MMRLSKYTLLAILLTLTTNMAADDLSSGGSQPQPNLTTPMMPTSTENPTGEKEDSRSGQDSNLAHQLNSYTFLLKQPAPVLALISQVRQLNSDQDSTPAPQLQSLIGQLEIVFDQFFEPNFRFEEEVCGRAELMRRDELMRRIRELARDCKSLCRQLEEQY